MHRKLGFRNICSYIYGILINKNKGYDDSRFKSR